MKKTKENAGITLVALVVTIIVLVILAGVSVNFAIGNKGILSIATKSVDETDKASAEEEIRMLMVKWEEAYYNEEFKSGVEVGTFADFIKAKLGDSGEMQSKSVKNAIISAVDENETTYLVSTKNGNELAKVEVEELAGN